MDGYDEQPAGLCIFLCGAAECLSYTEGEALAGCVELWQDVYKRQDISHQKAPAAKQQSFFFRFDKYGLINHGKDNILIHNPHGKHQEKYHKGTDAEAVKYILGRHGIGKTQIKKQKDEMCIRDRYRAYKHDLL